MRFLSAVLALGVLSGCGSGDLNVPISLGNPLGPATTSAHAVSASGGRNEGTQIWLVPAPGVRDLVEFAQKPEVAPNAERRIDVVSLYRMHGAWNPGFECGNPCGENGRNNYQALKQADVFRKLSERFILAFEGTSIKEHSCTSENLKRYDIAANLQAIANIKDAGGRLTYISLDEPFTAGTANAERSPFGEDFVGCGLSGAQVAALQKEYNDAIHALHPEIQIGLIEPYPYLSADEIVSYLLELERVRITPAYFHLDFDQANAVRNDKNWKDDIKRIREFCRAKGIPFGVILWGSDGRNNGEFATDQWNNARMALQSVGVTEHTVFQSWAENPPGQMDSVKEKPDLLPEVMPNTHTNLLLRGVEFMGIQIRR